MAVTETSMVDTYFDNTRSRRGGFGGLFGCREWLSAQCALSRTPCVLPSLRTPPSRGEICCNNLANDWPPKRRASVGLVIGTPAKRI